MITRDQRPSRGVMEWARGADNIGWDSGWSEILHTYRIHTPCKVKI